jgi:hypothetical protein
VEQVQTEYSLVLRGGRNEDARVKPRKSGNGSVTMLSAPEGEIPHGSDRSITRVQSEVVLLAVEGPAGVLTMRTIMTRKTRQSYLGSKKELRILRLRRRT